MNEFLAVLAKLDGGTVSFFFDKTKQAYCIQVRNKLANASHYITKEEYERTNNPDLVLLGLERACSLLDVEMDRQRMGQRASWVGTTTTGPILQGFNPQAQPSYGGYNVVWETCTGSAVITVEPPADA